MEKTFYQKPNLVPILILPLIKMASIGQGDINCGPSSHPDFIKNYFLLKRMFRFFRHSRQMPYFNVSRQKVTQFNVLGQKVTYLNERNRKEKEERGKRKMKEEKERERVKSKEKEERVRKKRSEEERERGLSLSPRFGESPDFFVDFFCETFP